MDLIDHDKRAHSRRSVRVPVICYPHGKRYDPQTWIFGETVDVGMDGLCIRFRGSCLLDVGSWLDLLILDPEKQEDGQTDVPACIRGQICWVKWTQQIFGVKYLQ